MKTPAKLSVLMPVHNGMPYLKDAVESILNQSLVSFDFIIVNDGSTDETNDYLNSLTDKRVQHHRRDKSGIGASLNYGLSKIKTEYTARMDSDDISLPQRLEKQMEYLEKHKDIALVGTQIEFIAEDTRKPGFRSHLPLSHDQIEKLLLKQKHALCHPSICFRTDAAQAIGGYKVSGAGEDLDFFLRMTEGFKIANLDDVLLYYRNHTESLNITQAKEIRLKYGYAAYCSQQRRKNGPEISFEDYTHQRSTPLREWIDSMDIMALTLYRNGITNILLGNKTKGAAQLAASTICSPERAWRYISKTFHRS